MLTLLFFLAVESLLSTTSFTSSLWILTLLAWTIHLEKKIVMLSPPLHHRYLKPHSALGLPFLRITKAIGQNG